MRIGRLTVDRRFLESRVARRMFAVVAASALLPVAAFALFAYGQVREQLEQDAGHLLRRESKAAGMAILERLFLASDAMRLRMLDPDPAGAPAWRTGSGARALRSLVAVPADDPRLAGLSDHARAHLWNGNTLLLVNRAASDAATFELLRLRASEDPSRGAWVATLEPEFVFTPLWRASSDRYRVTDSERSPLFVASTETRSAPMGSTKSAPLADDSAILRLDGEPWLTARWSLFLAAAFGAPAWEVEVARPLAEIHRPLHEFEALFPWIVGIALLGAFGLTLFQVRRSLVPIAALAEGARRLASGDLRARVSVASRDEFGELSGAFNEMAGVIEHQVDVLATVNRIGSALSAERDTSQLLDLILRGSMQVTRAGGAALFLLQDDGTLALSSARLGHSAAAGPEQLAAVLPLAAARRCIDRGELVRLDDLSRLGAEERGAWIRFAEHLGAPVCTYLTVPLATEDGESIGALLLLRHHAEGFSDAACSLAVSLASQAAVSIRKNRLVESFRALFEGLIQLTAKAIDEKSPYTGDHCRKVPIITELIADAACATDFGPLKDFSMTPEERYELRIAALLHDCGKVVTPVHVMDKATKLETIFDRIELVATRFEVLRRDVAIRALARRLGQAEAEAHLRSDVELARELAELESDLDFLRTCNTGSERGMPEADRERVRAIAGSHRWTPTGSSPCDILDPGDVENLTIRHGTLNDAERDVINGHVVTTISLLEELPFPPDMRAVPAIAGAHHERMNGTGYPLGLRGHQLGIQARILGLADVFEALTAKDRPYKPGRTLTETLEIIGGMCRNGHVDADIFDLMVREKIHLRYAAEYLSPEQIDPLHREALEELTEPWDPPAS